MFQSLMFISTHLIVKLTTSFHFSLNLITTLLIFGLILLRFDKVFDHLGLGNMLIILVVEKLLLMCLFFLSRRDFLQDLLLVSVSIVIDLGLLLFLLSFVQQSDLNFLVQFHLLSHLLFGGRFHVPSTLIHNVTSLLTSLINFFECSVFFLLKK